MTDNVAIVAGAGGELGRATSLALSAAGCTVVAVDRNERALGGLSGGAPGPRADRRHGGL
jgi:NAD(P)-dependent dehydrogenase (short-subunit alcohol dehydrogenase family)